MKIAVCLLLLTMAVISTWADDVEHKWQQFKGKHSRKYSSKEEITRKTQFIKTHKKIEKHNSENHSWKMAHNEFSDMIAQEKSARLGIDHAKIPPKQKNGSGKSERKLRVGERNLPGCIDYRDNKCMPPVKSQGACGSCWAFATMTPVEFAICNKTGTLEILSEQELVSCDPKNGGCGGGFYFNAWVYLNANGVERSDDYPYTADNNVCTLDSSKVLADKPMTWDWADPDGYDSTEIQEVLVSKGPLSAAILVIDSFFSYSTGVYDDPECNDGHRINHAVVITGYGTSSDGIPYWVIRNSWSTTWGQGGYALIRRGVNRCNIEYWPAWVSI